MTAARTRTAPKRAFVEPNGAVLCSIYEMLEENGLPPTRMQVYTRMGISYAASNERLMRLEREDLVTISADHRVQLTPKGLRRAALTVRKHRLVERLLVDIVGLEWEFAHEEAARWQHVLGERVERKLVQLLPEPWKSPFGNEIPAIDELGLGESQRHDVAGDGKSHVVRCDYFARQGGGVVTLHSIGEGAQVSHGLLRRLREAQVFPGMTLRVSKQSKREVIVIKCLDTELTIAPESASLIFVSVTVGLLPGEISSNGPGRHETASSH